jgi:hypothetical protein
MWGKKESRQLERCRTLDLYHEIHIARTMARFLAVSDASISNHRYPKDIRS